MKKFKFLFYILCILVIALLQSTVFENLKIYSVKPNLLLVFIITVSVITGNGEGAIVGFFCGLVQDFISGKVIGFYALLGLTLGALIEFFSKKLYGKNLPICIVCVFVFTILYEWIVCLFSFIQQKNFDFSFMFKHTIIYEALYNCIAVIFTYYLMSKVDKSFRSRADASKY